MDTQTVRKARLTMIHVETAVFAEPYDCQPRLTDLSDVGGDITQKRKTAAKIDK